MGPVGFEPTTSRLSAGCSSQTKLWARRERATPDPLLNVSDGADSATLLDARDRPDELDSHRGAQERFFGSVPGVEVTRDGSEWSLYSRWARKAALATSRPNSPAGVVAVRTRDGDAVESAPQAISPRGSIPRTFPPRRSAEQPWGAAVGPRWYAVSARQTAECGTWEWNALGVVSSGFA